MIYSIDHNIERNTDINTEEQKKPQTEFNTVNTADYTNYLMNHFALVHCSALQCLDTVPSLFNVYQQLVRCPN